MGRKPRYLSAQLAHSLVAAGALPVVKDFDLDAEIDGLGLDDAVSAVSAEQWTLLAAEFVSLPAAYQAVPLSITNSSTLHIGSQRQARDEAIDGAMPVPIASEVFGIETHSQTYNAYKPYTLLLYAPLLLVYL